jgi:ribonuclease G
MALEPQIKAEILTNITPHETRVAIIENGVLQEIHVERENQRGIVGNIYKGKIIRVLPGMQAAFVNIGLEKAGFLHVSDVMPICSEEDEEIDLNSAQADVRKWLRDGQEILVQVMKDPLGTKGARLTAHLSLASRYLVYIPDLDHIGVSLRIESEPERNRLQSIMQDALETDMPSGFIVRTVAEGITEGKIKWEIEFLKRLWDEISSNSAASNAPTIVYEDLNLSARVLRDYVNDNVDKVRIDNLDKYSELCHFADKFVPGVRDRMDYYAGEEPIFEMYGVEQELESALDRRVQLKSGGFLIIDQTEAMITIDVNTGAYIGKVNLEETIFKTNLEAAKSIGRQLRLRNLGGIIIIDFIDMNDAEHAETVLSTFKQVLARDYARTNVGEISPLGLVEMTRKRTQESLMKYMCEPCKTCGGKGLIKTVQTICYEIFREILRESKAYTSDGFMIVASHQVIDALVTDESTLLGELELEIGKPIKTKIEHSYSQENYEIILM